MTPEMIKELQTVSQQQVDHLAGHVFAELDKLRADMQAVSKSRPDTDILIENREPFQYFEFIALASYRLRGKWKRANEAAKALEKRRVEWDIMISAALLHTRHELTQMEKGTPDYEAHFEKIISLIDMLAMTFRPVAGPNAQWVAVTAATIGTGVR